MALHARAGVLRSGGLVVILGGLLMILVNAGLTPLLPFAAPFSEVAASGAFAWRQSLAIAAALLLTVGSVPLHVGQADRGGPLAALAFLVAFVGGALLVAHEWNQVFLVRDLALRMPASLDALEDAPGMTLFDISALVAVSTFTLGWLALAVVMLLRRVYRRSGPLLLIAGFFLVPILSAALPRPWGAVIGNVVLGMGWLVLGRELLRLADAGRAA